MSLQEAADILGDDLRFVQTELLRRGWPVRARVVGTGVNGSALFVRFNAEGEEYLFTITGPSESLERYIANNHALLQRMVPHLNRVPCQGCDVGYQGPSIEPNPAPRREAQRAMLHSHPFEIRRRPDGLWSATVTLPTPGGPLHLCATADEHAVAQAMAGEVAAIGGDRRWLGSKQYRTLVGEVAEKRALDRVGGSLQGLIASGSAEQACGSDFGSSFGNAMRGFLQDKTAGTIMQTVVPLVPVVGPAASLAYGGAKMALDLTDKAQQGDPVARQEIVRISRAAKSGEPDAVRALVTMKAAVKARKEAVKEAARRGEAANQQKLLSALSQQLNEVQKSAASDRARIESVSRENESLKAKLEAAQRAWVESPTNAADEFLDLFGGSDGHVGLDIVQAVGSMVGTLASEVGGVALARPVVSRYLRGRLPQGTRHHECTPEVGALYNRPMREGNQVSIRRDYLRGQAILNAPGPSRTLQSFYRR